MASSSGAGTLVQAPRGLERPAAVTAEDVDVHFFPCEPAEDEVADWVRAVSGALRAEGGTVTLVFVRRASSWLLSAFHWHPPKAGFLEVASEEACRPLRDRACEALRGAGKPVTA
jgi:hypothetical protein